MMTSSPLAGTAPPSQLSTLSQCHCDTAACVVVVELIVPDVDVSDVVTVNGMPAVSCVSVITAPLLLAVISLNSGIVAPVAFTL